MVLSQLIKELERLKKTHGDIPVRVQSLTHVWAPDPVIRNEKPINGYVDPWILLNP